MKYIEFKHLKIRNFLSVGDEIVSVDFKTGLNIITGINKDKEDRRNGVGKSTIADAVYFSVFGNTIRELRKEHIVNNITQSNCEVSLDFDVHDNGNTDKCRIIRTLSPTRCKLYINDCDKTRDSIANTNELISQTINSTPEVFQNCVIMTINNTTPFMAKKKLEKRRFIEGIFNLQVFSSMLTLARGEINEITKDFNIECAKYEEVSNTLVTYTDQQAEIDEEKDRRIKTLQQRKQDNKDQISTYTRLIENIKLLDRDKTKAKINQLNDASDKLKKKINNLQQNEVELKTNIKMLSAQLQEIGTSKSTCPVCLKNITDHDVEHINNEKQKITSNIADIKNNVEDVMSNRVDTSSKREQITSTITKLNNSLYKDDLNRQELTNTHDKIDNLKKLDSQIEMDLKNVKDNKHSLRAAIKKTEEKLETIQKDIDVYKRKLDLYDIIKFIVSEEGVKSYIVKKILQLFNSKLAYYLKKMDSNCICVFNEYFEEQIIDEKGKFCSYFNFSGAERKNIDLACLFTFMDIRRLQGDVAFNFSIYDELFDSSLDERGVELVTEILKERVEKHNECIMVISHRKESVKSATGEIIFLQKQNGITTRVDSPTSTI